MHINSSISSLIGGVSQQPELLRLPSHLRVQENGYSTPAKGLSKRPSTRHRGHASGFTGVGFHTSLDYGPRGVFHLTVDNSTGMIRMTDAGGAPVPLYAEGGAPLSAVWYLVTATPETSLRVVKEADTTFLVNTDMVTTEYITPPSSVIWMALIWVRAGNYGRDYKVSIPGFTTAVVSTPDGSLAAHLADTKTDVIAAQLASQLITAGVPGVVANGSVIALTLGGYAGMTVEDGSGGSSLTAVYKSIRSVAELPSRKAPDGFTVKVDGGDATGAGDHYLAYNADEGVYKEVRSPVEGYGTPMPSTMPHRMVPYADGFLITSLAYTGRIVGDSVTSPPPGFMGKRINDLFFFQDRMGLLSGEGGDISEVGEYYNFYRTTVVDLLDSDPISFTVSHPKVSTLRHAIPFNKRLLFFSDKAQFELASGDFLTPKAVATRQLTEFECSSYVRPVGIGTSLYFPVDKGSHSAFYNFFVSGVDSLEDATDISGHIPEYVPPNVSQMAASPVNNLILALSKDAPSSLFVYQFYQDGPNRLQSAWHKWPYDATATILSMTVVDTRVILLVKRNTQAGVVVSIEEVALSGSPYATRLDRKFSVGAAQLTATGEGLYATTNIPLAYAAGPGDYYAVVTTGSPTVKAGSVYLLVNTVGATSATAKANLTGCAVEVGLGYTFRATLGRFLLREQAGGGSAGVSRGRTQVSRMWVNYADATTFAVEVATPGGTTRVYRETGRLLGTGSARIGDRPVGDGRFGCPVLAENTRVDITLVNDTPLPSSFLSVDWEGYHVARGQHV